MTWFLYLIECTDGSIYTGITTDVSARFAAHANGTGARYTRSHPPRQLLASLSFPDRSSASKAEYEVKQLSAAEKRAFAKQHTPHKHTPQAPESELKISAKLSIPLREIDISAIRAQGAGGQNVNKVASAIHLRFDISASSLPDHHKEQLLNLNDQRITKDGIVVIKAQQFRSQNKNREDALQRLRELLQGITMPIKKRTPTKPTLGAQQRRLDSKNKRSNIKTLRGKVIE